MADIAVHGSTPAVVTGSTSAVTASFSPPASSLLVACVFANEGNSGTTITMSNSGTALTWAQRARRDETDASSQSGLAAVFTAPCAAGASNITVTAATNRTGGIGVKVWVLTGAHLTTPVGATGEGSSTTNATTPNAYTSTGANSFGICAANEWNDNGLPTSTDNEDAAYNSGLALAGMGITKAAVTATVGTTVTFNMDASSTSAAAWNWCAVEILKGSVDATVTPTTATLPLEFPAAGVSAGATASPSTLAPPIEFPTPGLSAGANHSATTLSLAVEFPAASVTTDSVEVISAATLTAPIEFPAAGVSAGAGIAAQPLALALVFPAPTVTGQFNATIVPDTLEIAPSFPAAEASVPILPGQFITEPGQVEWGGTLWGAGTDFRVVGEIAGWESLPQLDDLSAIRPSRHGAYPGRRLAQPRIVNIDLQVQSGSDPNLVDLLIKQLRFDTRVLDNDTEWSLVIRGYGEPLLAYGSIRDRSMPMGGDYNVGLPTVGVVIGCTDPRRYSLTQQSEVVAVGGAAHAVTNGGDVYTSPRIRMSGPLTNPTLTNLTLDRVLAFDLTVGAGELLEIDVQLGTVKIGSVSHMDDLSGAASVPVEDFVIGVGDNDLTYETGSGGTAGAEFIFRDAYL